MSYIPWSITLLRLIVPFFILRFPLLGILASTMADSLDWNIIKVTSDEMNAVYQSWDKAMDSYSFLFVVWVTLQWKDVWARNVALGLFVYRIIGVILFWITGWQAALFFFPNMFQNFVIVILMLFWLTKKEKLNFDLQHKAVLLCILIIPKMIHEYFQHFLGRQPWEIYSFGDWLGLKGEAIGNVNWILWIGLLYVIPVTAFLLYTRGGKYLSSKRK